MRRFFRNFVGSKIIIPTKGEKVTNTYDILQMTYYSNNILFPETK